MTAADMLDRGGIVARRLPGYEPRPQQVDMARAVEDAFAAPRHALIEAGTGVGKSFAYLLPAIDWALQHDARVVISTHTIALQEQLISKDLPFLASVYPKPFRAALVKGRSNYLGLRRLARTSQRRDLVLGTAAQHDELWRIEQWAYGTGDGSRSDLDFEPTAPVWDRVSSDGGDCMGRRCPHFRKCFYQRARRGLEDAQVLVSNHALFFSDLALRRHGASILPDYGVVVLDEAHTVESVASDHFGAEVSSARLPRLLNTLYDERRQKGALAPIEHTDAIKAVLHARVIADRFFTDIADWRRTRGPTNGRLAEPMDVPNRLSPALRKLAEALNRVRGDAVDEADRLELSSAVDRCGEIAAALDDLHQQRHDGWVYWVDVSTDRGLRVTLRGQPIDVGPALTEHLFSKVPSVVMTSATLATDPASGFAYMSTRLGLTDAGADTVALGSPFDYRRNVTVHVEAGMPEPATGDVFIRAACDRIQRYLRASRGRAFVLFTSYDMMNRCAAALSAFFESEPMTLLVQGTGMPRSKMLAAFRTTSACVLFGTDSFWTGVDVPGEALSNVIIVKLPFAAPNRPLIEARIERIRAGGENPFMTFQVPEAVLKFKQAFGRLVRGRGDTGIVAILDPRVVTRPYGRRFLSALPDCEVVIHEQRHDGTAPGSAGHHDA